MLVSRKPAWFIASYAMPPVIAPSPMTCRAQVDAEQKQEQLIAEQATGHPMDGKAGFYPQASAQRSNRVHPCRHPSFPHAPQPRCSCGP